MKRKNSKPKAKKAKQSAPQLDAIRVWLLSVANRVTELENRVTRLEQTQGGAGVASPQSLPEGGLPPQT